MFKVAQIQRRANGIIAVLLEENPTAIITFINGFKNGRRIILAIVMASGTTDSVSWWMSGLGLPRLVRGACDGWARSIRIVTSDHQSPLTLPCRTSNCKSSGDDCQRRGQLEAHLVEYTYSFRSKIRGQPGDEILGDNIAALFAASTR